MSNITCPYCDDRFEFETDDGWPEQDENIEVECPYCDSTFGATASIELYFHNVIKLPCKNGECECCFEKTSRYPLVIFKKISIRCKYCSTEKNIPFEEGIKYGYTQEEIDKSVELDEKLYYKKI